MQEPEYRNPGDYPEIRAVRLNTPPDPEAKVEGMPTFELWPTWKVYDEDVYQGELVWKPGSYSVFDVRHNLVGTLKALRSMAATTQPSMRARRAAEKLLGLGAKKR